VCGDDGCGGSCGPCDGGTCEGGACIRSFGPNCSPGVCCATGEACIDQVCGACPAFSDACLQQITCGRPGSSGPACLCVIATDGPACVSGDFGADFCFDCETSADCAAELGLPEEDVACIQVNCAPCLEEGGRGCVKRCGVA
jgi:hypothetical protein